MSFSFLRKFEGKEEKITLVYTKLICIAGRGSSRERKRERVGREVGKKSSMGHQSQTRVNKVGA